MTSFMIPENLIHASFFFTDIVGLSDPKMSTNTQSSKIEILNESIEKCSVYKNTPKEKIIVLPTGDGMVIGFLNGVEQPIKLAMELHKKLNDYNDTKEEISKIHIRIGCHVGNVFTIDDIHKNKNYWGPGLILSRRVMDLGNSDHILITSIMADNLLELSDDYKKILHPLHDYEIKHEQVMLVYSVYGEDFGNLSKPTMTAYPQKNNFVKLGTYQKPISYRNIKFRISLKNQTENTVQYERKYDLMNTSDEPIYEVSNGIMTNVEKHFHELNVQIIDERQKELAVSGISTDTPYRKEFRIKLNSPVFKGDENKSYILKYVIKEHNRFHENMFLTNSKKIIYQFIYRMNEFPTSPKLFIIEEKNREKKILEISSKKINGNIVFIEWIKDDGITEKDIVRIEW